MKKKHTEYYLLLLILGAALCLFLANLGNHYLWQDEAQTALISKTILTHGLPLGYDGKNYFSQESGAEYGKNYIWKWHTWLSFYVLAAFYKLFGLSTFVSRLPFALFGIGSVFLTYQLCRAMWQDKRIAFTAAALLLVSVPFLILSRQCRYYSMTAFFSLWGLYAYIGLLSKKKYAYVAFILSLTLLFHTHYIYSATLLATVFLHALLFHRNRLLHLLFLTGIAILINVPWIVWLTGMKYGRYGSSMFQITKILTFTTRYLEQIARYIFSPYLLIIVLVVPIIKRIKTGSFFSRDRLFRQNLALLLLFIFVNFSALVLTVPSTFFRYLTPMIPVLTILVAMVVVAVAKIHISAAVLVLVALLATGNLRNYLYEITHDYDGPIEGITNYLNEHGNDNDVVFITYGDMPLKFYTPMRIVGGLTAEDLSDADDPDWVIVRRHSPPRLGRVIKHLQKIPLSNYRDVVIDYPDIINENREYPAKHRFRTAVNEQRVRIYRRIR